MSHFGGKIATIPISRVHHQNMVKNCPKPKINKRRKRWPTVATF